MSSAVPLTQAVTSGDANAVRAAIASGADVNERNNGGQTALILAVIFGHADLVRLLVKAGANPRLRDNLGLDAVEWAQRRGLPLDLFEIREIRVEGPPPDTDEKSRKWLAGIKERIQEQSAPKQQPVVEPPPKPAPEPEPEPIAVVAPTTPPTTSPVQKRCPKCNAIYNSELVAYCAHHVVRLVDVDAPVFEPPQSVTSTITNTPLIWMLVLATVSVAAFTGYMIMSQLSSVIPDSAASAPSHPLSFMKGTPAATGDLVGKAVNLAEAECPVYEKLAGTNTNTNPQTVNVHIKLDKSGKVFWARAEGGNEAMRTAATEAATQSTFSPDKLRGRETQGTITYTFAP